MHEEPCPKGVHTSLTSERVRTSGTPNLDDKGWGTHPKGWCPFGFPLIPKVISHPNRFTSSAYQWPWDKRAALSALVDVAGTTVPSFSSKKVIPNLQVPESFGKVAV